MLSIRGVIWSIGTINESISAGETPDVGSAVDVPDAAIPQAAMTPTAASHWRVLIGRPPFFAGLSIYRRGQAVVRRGLWATANAIAGRPVELAKHGRTDQASQRDRQNSCCDCRRCRSIRPRTSQPLSMHLEAASQALSSTNWTTWGTGSSERALNTRVRAGSCGADDGNRTRVFSLGS